MCGIVALFRAGGAAQLSPMLDAIRHRGPDDSGAEELGDIAIGTRRLAIIDLPGGHQPLANEDRTVWAACNGEIYNHAQLRQELIAERHRFATASDTEVLVHGYEAWGLEGLLSRLRGMYAFALVDTRTRALLLARDRLGKKPLYLARAGAGWAAASEIKALFAHPAIAPALDEDRIPESLANRFVTGSRTVFANVTRLLPGHWMKLSAQGNETRAYWVPPAEDGRSVPPDMPGEVRRRVDEAVRLRLVADVPLGVLLSGGLDSSVVTAAMKAAGADPLRSYTVGFEGSGDEREAARLVARHLETEHTEQLVSLDATALLDEVVWHLDEPLADAAALPTLLICRAARAHVKVVLVGEGADELFLGYPRYLLSRIADRALALPEALRRTFFGAAARFFPGRAGLALDRLAGAPEDVLVRNALWQSGADPRTIAALTRRPAINWQQWYVAEERRASPKASGLGAVLRRDLTAWLVDDILIKLDRMSMAASLEARAPFLDHELVEFICRLPVEARFAARGKQWLRAAYREALPVATLERRKHPFKPPVAEWLRGQLGLTLQAAMVRPGSFTASYLDRATAQGLLDEHRRGADHALLLWSLLVHEMWWRRFFGGGVAAA